MNLRFEQLTVVGTHGARSVDFAYRVTFIHGPMGAGKSTIARLIYYCLGGRLEQTPAIRASFVSVRLVGYFEAYRVVLERGSHDSSTVRVTWEREPGKDESGDRDVGAANAPIQGATEEIRPGIFNLSDLLYSFLGLEPLRVRRNKQDPDAPLVRLGFRELFRFCYLPQDLLDSSFYRLEDSLRYKSRDAMRYIVGLYSDRLNELEAELDRAVEKYRGIRVAVDQVRIFLARFDLDNPIEIEVEIQKVRTHLVQAKNAKSRIEADHAAATHFADDLRSELRDVTRTLAGEEEALADLSEKVSEQESLRAELVTAKIKAARSTAADSVLSAVEFLACPRCGLPLDQHRTSEEKCYVCLQSNAELVTPDIEALYRDLDSRIDELGESTARHAREAEQLEDRVRRTGEKKAALDAQLSEELQRYDSAFLSRSRSLDRKISRLNERRRSLERGKEMASEIDAIERQGAEARQEIERLRTAVTHERDRLVQATENVTAIEEEFLRTLVAIHFPGVDDSDRVELSTRTWIPGVLHTSQEHPWTFFDAGSGGKKVMFNVSYALALHKVAVDNGLPLPMFLMIDSPLKNISPDVNPELVEAFYRDLYTALDERMRGTQVVIIDSELIEPPEGYSGFESILMDPADPDNPPLIPGYSGP